jgi:hypothetical protein
MTQHKLSDYAKQLLSLPNDKRPAGRRKGWTRTGSVLAGKELTDWEKSVVASSQTYHKNRWAILFAQPLNKWKHHP